MSEFSYISLLIIFYNSIGLILLSGPGSNFYKWLMNVRKKTLQMKDFYIFISHIDYNCQSLLVLLIFQINETSVLSKPT